MISSNAETWTYDEFLSFILLHVAKADFKISIEESDFLSEHIPSPTLKELTKLHRMNSDYENVQLIINLGTRYCTSPEDKELIMNKVMEIIMADGEYNFYEKNAKRSLEMLLSI